MDVFYDVEYAEINSSISVNETFDDDINIDPAIYFKVLSVFIIRAGLFITEVISTPSNNIQVLVLHNMIDMSVTFLGYGLVGYVFAYGKDFQSIIGIDGFISEDTNFSDFIQGWSIVVIVSGLITASIGDRVSFFSGFIINLLTSCIAFPVLLHWILSPNGWMRVMQFAGVYVSYKDYSHSCLVHMSGGYVGFLGMLILNKRMIRFKDLDSSSIPDVGPNLALFGYFLTLLGFIGLSIPTRKYFQSHLVHNFYGIILVNIIFAVAGTMSMTLLLTFICPCRDRLSKWATLRFAQAGISGVAVIAGGADVYHPFSALCAGAINGLIFFCDTHIMRRTNLEDFCNISAVHFFSGFIGTLLPPIMGVREGFRTVLYNDFIHFSWQLVCDATILIYLSILFYPVLALFDRCGILRTWEEDINHKRALSTMKITPKLSFTKRLFDWEDRDQRGNSRNSTGQRRKSKKDSNHEKVNIIFKKNYNEKLTPTRRVPVPLSGDEGQGQNIQSEQKKFFPRSEQIDSESTKASDLRSEFADQSNVSKVFENNILNGIRNLSDSKLFCSLKESSGNGKSKRQTSYSRSRFSSISNMWMPSTSSPASSHETEV